MEKKQFEMTEQDFIEALGKPNSKLNVSIPSVVLIWPHIGEPHRKEDPPSLRYRTHLLIPKQHKERQNTKFLWNLMTALQKINSRLDRDKPWNRGIWRLVDYMHQSPINDKEKQHNEKIKSLIDEGFELVLRARTKNLIELEKTPQAIEDARPNIYYRKDGKNKLILTHTDWSVQKLSKVGDGTPAHASVTFHQYSSGGKGITCYLNSLILDINNIKDKQYSPEFDEDAYSDDLDSFEVKEESFNNVNVSVENMNNDSDVIPF